jgi:predicted hydrocarbon binding protein
MSEENYQVSGLYLRGALAGLRKITGRQYPTLLERAGLSRYSEKYPPATLEKVASYDQLIKLLEAIKVVAGPVVFNLFFTNLGRGFGQAMATLPQLQSIANLESFNSQSARIKRLVESIGELHYNAVGGLVTTKEIELNTLNITYYNCIYCVTFSQAEKPVCVNIPALYKQLLWDIMRVNLQMEETHCGAVTHERNCQFRLKYLFSNPPAQK